MRVVVSLRDVVAEMDLPNEEWTTYLNQRAGELITVTDEDRLAAGVFQTSVGMLSG